MSSRNEVRSRCLKRGSKFQGEETASAKSWEQWSPKEYGGLKGSWEEWYGRSKQERCEERLEWPRKGLASFFLSGR